MSTILTAFGIWTLGAAAGGIVGNFSHEGVKKLGKSFADKLKEYYINEEDAVKHFEMMNTVNSSNPNKPFRDVEDTFEEVTKSSFPEGFVQEFKEWITENQKTLLDSTINTSGVFNIGTQTASGDINNVSGVQIVNRGASGVNNE